MIERPEITAEEFAALIGGRWERRPHSNWRYRGLCYSPVRYTSEEIALIKDSTARYGFEPHELKSTMSEAGVILPATLSLSPRIAVPTLRIASIHESMLRLATALRARAETRIIAVTGTVGKTSSCNLLRHLLEGDHTVSSNNGLNYGEGVILEIANLGASDYAIFEVSRAAISENVPKVLKPHVALLTHVSPVHVSSRVDLLATARHKSCLFAGLEPGGTAVINRDIYHFEEVRNIAAASASEILTFGEHETCDFRLLDYDPSGQDVRAKILGETVAFRLGLRGRHMAIDSLGALAAAHAAGVQWQTLLPRCSTVLPVSGRGKTETLTICGSRVTVIDDSHNASPASMLASFRLLSETSPTGVGRRIAVLGDMLEMGDDAPALHRALAEPLMACAPNLVYLAGESMLHLHRALPECLSLYCGKEADEILRPLVSRLREGDVVLLKGSHGTRIHRLAEELRLLGLAPHPLPGIKQVTLPTYFFLRSAMRWLAPRLPMRLSRWVSWQLRKLARAD